MAGVKGRSGARTRPAGMHVLSGTHRKDRHGDEDVARREVAENRAAGALEAPRWLDSAARREWKRVEPLLREAGVTSPRDRAALAAYCEAWSRYSTAAATIKREGLIVATERGAQRHPAVGIANQAAQQLRSFAIELGLTPSSRAALPKGRPSDSPLSKFQAEFGGRSGG